MLVGGEGAGHCSGGRKGQVTAGPAAGPAPPKYLHPGLDLESVSHGAEREGGSRGGREVESVWEWRRGRDGMSDQEKQSWLPIRHPGIYLPRAANLTLLRIPRLSPHSQVGNGGTEIKDACLSHYSLREPSPECWCMPVSSVQEQPGQEDCNQLGSNLEYIVSSRPELQNKTRC